MSTWVTALESSRLESDSARWYALYTAPRHEKKVVEQLSQQGVICFLPLYRSLRQWKDRRKELTLVLFPGYVFVRGVLQDRLKVLRLPGAVRFVSFNGQPAPLSDLEIEGLRSRIGDRGVEPHPYLQVGRRVRVRRGPLEGLEGIIQRTKDSCRIVFTIELISRSVAVEVDESEVESIA